MRQAALDWLRARVGLGVAAGLAFGGWAMFGGAARAGAPVATALLIGVLALAAWLTWDGLLRLRLGTGRATGIVEIREGRIGYFGPETGGIIDLDLIMTIAVEPGWLGATWVLRPEQGEGVRIPMAAAGADALLDVFAALPGFTSGRVARVARGRQPQPVWHRATDGNDHDPRSVLASPEVGPYMGRHRG